ncbi:MAG: hypothetical protein ACJAWW_002522 [Sulfurimonas sp.]|jgi:hypothetical protein
MKTVDTKRRTVLKGALAASAIAAFGSSLHAGESGKKESIVLLSDTSYSKAFLDGLNQADKSLNHVENVNIIQDYSKFTSIMKSYLNGNKVTAITGLLKESDYMLMVEYFQSNGVNLKAEIYHNISNSGTKHYITTSHTASGIISNAKRTLDQNDQWAFLSGFILGGSSADLSQNSAKANSFEEVTISRNERGDTNLISFLATISKEKQYV